MNKKGVLVLFGILIAFSFIGIKSVFLPSTSLIDESPTLRSLYAPWRGIYKQKMKQTDECPFCRKNQVQQDREQFVLGRYNHFMIGLNWFPYSKGHLLIIPYNHVKDIKDLPPEAREEFVQLLIAAIDILREELHPEGINLGVNLGKAAGASIPDHLHTHVVPRWLKNEGFIDSVARTNIVSEEFDVIYDKLVGRFKALETSLK